MEAFLEMSLSREDSLQTQLEKWEHGSSCSAATDRGQRSCLPDLGAVIEGAGSEASAELAVNEEELFDLFGGSLPPPDALFDEPVGSSRLCEETLARQMAVVAAMTAQADELDLESVHAELQCSEPHQHQIQQHQQQHQQHLMTLVGLQDHDDALSDIFSSSSSTLQGLRDDLEPAELVLSATGSLQFAKLPATPPPAPRQLHVLSHLKTSSPISSSSPRHTSTFKLNKSRGAGLVAGKRSFEAACASTEGAPCSKKRAGASEAAARNSAASKPVRAACADAAAAGKKRVASAVTSAPKNAGDAAVVAAAAVTKQQKIGVLCAPLPSGSDKSVSGDGADSGSAERGDLDLNSEGSSSSSPQSASKACEGSTEDLTAKHRCTKDGCGKVFSRKHNLKVHMRKHTGEMPYACPHKGCSKSFKWKSSMKYHDRLHSKELAAASAAASAALNVGATAAVAVAAAAAPGAMAASASEALLL
mmetsp:Transcript_11102/g.29806  ORF Transcript_11102/g.29806 Transcript_11102/m.29806 type:complete len:476 (-) Transcript_11102:191-1618(-)|eukprot:CAMPEP_0185834648 /NCGR_PEP_ID=MMETSP1353-20130828/5849_1 /TAXON_ID=1077150 /ORGANISM="Erythrolobus australicus, Strain CCMP3124" /LENGTH=475 /DNA_ID=CAMNT_0028533121 /DNA_START=202 /DNA_END=1629 /DNA_ORIENTATION=+